MEAAYLGCAYSIYQHLVPNWIPRITKWKLIVSFQENGKRKFDRGASILLSYISIVIDAKTENTHGN